MLSQSHVNYICIVQIKTTRLHTVEQTWIVRAAQIRDACARLVHPLLAVVMRKLVGILSSVINVTLPKIARLEVQLATIK